MRIVVTGIGGFVGAAVARACLASGMQVTGIYRKTPPRRIPAMHRLLSTVRTDLRDCEGLPSRYDCLVHCAADVPATCPDPDEMVRSNVEGTRRIFDHAAAAGANRVIYLSSMAAYGRITARIVTEDTPPNSPDAYGSSKAEGERLMRRWCERTKGSAAAIRLPGVVGAGGRNNFLCDTLQRILSGQAVKARNPDALFNNVVHVEDLAAFVVGLTVQPLKGATILTLAAREAMAMHAVLSRLFWRAAATERIEWLEPGGTPFQISFERASALGYRAATVADSIDRFVADVLADAADGRRGSA